MQEDTAEVHGLVESLAAIPGGIAVLCGGPGGEREVSLASGENVHEALQRAGLPNRLAVAPVEDPEDFVENLPCGVAVMMFHGQFGEGGVAQAILERRGIPYSGSDSRACRLAMDKHRTKEAMVAAGLPTAGWVAVESDASAISAVEQAGLAYPLFVKPNFGGSSVGVSRVDSPGELTGAVAHALEDDVLVVIEEMVDGRELTVGWLDGRILPVIELGAQGVFYDYHAKYQSEETRYTCPAAIDAELNEALARHAASLAEIVGARDVARVDVMVGRGGPMILELNALPGFTSHSLLPMAAGAAGMPVEEVCVRLAAMAAGRAGVIR